MTNKKGNSKSKPNGKDAAVAEMLFSLDAGLKPGSIPRTTAKSKSRSHSTSLRGGSSGMTNKKGNSKSKPNGKDAAVAEIAVYGKDAAVAEVLFTAKPRLWLRCCLVEKRISPLRCSQ
jgi:hypothetical protein